MSVYVVGVKGLAYMEIPRISGGKQENQSATSGSKQSILNAFKSIKLFPPPIIKFEWPKYDAELNSTFDGKKAKYKEKLRILREVQDKNELPIEEELRRRKKRAVEQMQKVAANNIKVIMGEKELKGKYRFVAEGFANASECSKLVGLAQVAAVQGDGYHGNMNPHTSHETFEGVTLGRAALLVYLGLIDVEILELYLRLSEMGRDYLERYFNLKTELYFTYTHLVCRTALAGSPINRTDMSHSVHADNCNILESGECSRKPPAYTWRDFSAILYLNQDFEGGEFIFTTDISAKKVESIVKPQCGRLVGFSAGRENLHGVQGVQKGRRCAVGLWFTFNPIYEEIERILAKQVLYQVQESGNVADQLIQELKKYVMVQEPVSSIFLDKKTTRTTNKQQHKVRNKYIKKSLKFKEKHFYVLQHKKPIKLLIERHKEANILNFNAP